MRVRTLKGMLEHILATEGDVEIVLRVDNDYPGEEALDWVELWQGVVYVGSGEKPAFRTREQLELEAQQRALESQRRMEEKYPQYEGMWPWS